MIIVYYFVNFIRTQYMNTFGKYYMNIVEHSWKKYSVKNIVEHYWWMSIV